MKAEESLLRLDAKSAPASPPTPNASAGRWGWLSIGRHPLSPFWQSQRAPSCPSPSPQASMNILHHITSGRQRQRQVPTVPSPRRDEEYNEIRIREYNTDASHYFFFSVNGSQELFFQFKFSIFEERKKEGKWRNGKRIEKNNGCGRDSILIRTWDPIVFLNLEERWWWSYPTLYIWIADEAPFFYPSVSENWRCWMPFSCQFGDFNGKRGCGCGDPSLIAPFHPTIHNTNPFCILCILCLLMLMLIDYFLRLTTCTCRESESEFSSSGGLRDPSRTSPWRWNVESLHNDDERQTRDRSVCKQGHITHKIKSQCIILVSPIIIMPLWLTFGSLVDAKKRKPNHPLYTNKGDLESSTSLCFCSSPLAYEKEV